MVFLEVLELVKQVLMVEYPNLVGHLMEPMEALALQILEVQMKVVLG